MFFDVRDEMVTTTSDTIENGSTLLLKLTAVLPTLSFTFTKCANMPPYINNHLQDVLLGPTKIKYMV